MIRLSDEIGAWGHFTTVHYTHPSRSVVTQVSLANRGDFTQQQPETTLFGARAHFTGYVAGGVATDLLQAPNRPRAQFHADGLTEVHGRLLAENCGAVAVISQFDTQPVGESYSAAAPSARTVAFIRTFNNTIRYKHVVKTFAGGRAVSETEAIHLARANAAKFGIDVNEFDMRVTVDDPIAPLAARLDAKTGAFIAVDD